MKELFESSNIEELIQRIFAHIKTREENPRTIESGFTLVQIMHLHISFQLLALIRGSFYTELPEWIAKKTAVINRKSEMNSVVPLMQHYIMKRLLHILNKYRSYSVITINTTGMGLDFHCRTKNSSEDACWLTKILQLISLLPSIFYFK